MNSRSVVRRAVQATSESSHCLTKHVVVACVSWSFHVDLCRRAAHRFLWYHCTQTQIIHLDTRSLHSESDSLVVRKCGPAGPKTRRDSSCSVQRQLRITHGKICWTAVRRRELPFSGGAILQERPEMLRRLDKFDLVTHSKEHIEECACHLSGKQCQSWPVMDRSPRSATSETPAMANGTNGSSAF